MQICRMWKCFPPRPLFPYFLYVRCHKFLGTERKTPKTMTANNLKFFRWRSGEENVSLCKRTHNWNASHGLTKASQNPSKTPLSVSRFREISPAFGYFPTQLLQLSYALLIWLGFGPCRVVPSYTTLPTTADCS